MTRGFYGISSSQHRAAPSLEFYVYFPVHHGRIISFPIQILCKLEISKETGVFIKVKMCIEDNTSTTTSTTANTTSTTTTTASPTTTTTLSTTITTASPTNTTTLSTTTSTVQAVTAPATCTSTGVYEAENCNQYYECVYVMWWYELVLQTCSSGQAFNTTAGACTDDIDAKAIGYLAKSKLNDKLHQFLQLEAVFSTLVRNIESEYDNNEKVLFLSLLGFFRVEGCGSKNIECLTNTTFRFCFSFGTNVVYVNSLVISCSSGYVCDESDGTYAKGKIEYSSAHPPLTADLTRSARTRFPLPVPSPPTASNGKWQPSRISAVTLPLAVSQNTVVCEETNIGDPNMMISENSGGNLLPV
ncbi:hypothetical protein NQ317_011120 [Molorchus minor]|uniref:Chitin-binding type-2 domain-containing protein n=1 Tax=Molorchus minor TaxID=1323400 RepID=A0ABQ9K0S0_9CUCU|nr:hypothetical protein NQ317_011120 [Molorchus minor]